MEHKICLDSAVAVLAEGDGIVTKVDAYHVSVTYDDGRVTKDYKLIKFLRSNHGTCINQQPIVAVGERVHGGDDPRCWPTALPRRRARSLWAATFWWAS